MPNSTNGLEAYLRTAELLNLQTEQSHDRPNEAAAPTTTNSLPSLSATSRRTLRPPSPFGTLKQLGEFNLTTPLVTPGALCSISTLFFQQSVSHSAIIHGFASRPPVGPPGVISIAGHLSPHHSDCTAHEMGLEPSILRSPSNLARHLEILDQRLERASPSAAAGSTPTDPWGTDETLGVPECELPLIISLSQWVFGDDIAQRVRQQAGAGVEMTSSIFLTHLGHVVATPRRVCQHPFKRNDIVWVCRTCQSDETCVLCHACWTRSNHEGHDVAFYHAQAGGCCDCGDPDAWDPNGFCDVHGMHSSSSTFEDTSASAQLTQKCRGVVEAIMDWLTTVVAADAQASFYPAPASSEDDGSDERDDYTHVDAEVNEDLNLRMISNASAKHTQRDAIEGALSGDTTYHTVLSTATSTSTCEEHSEPCNSQDMMDLDPSTISNSPERSRDTQTQLEANSPQPQMRLHPSRLPLESILSAQAATPRTRILSKQTHQQFEQTAYQLAHRGRNQGGLYLILHCLDIPPYELQVRDKSTVALSDVLGPVPSHSVTLYHQSISLCKQFGELALLGTSDIVTGVGIETSKCWRDGDHLKTTLVGKWMLEQVTKLQTNGGNWNVSVKTHLQLLREQRATAIVSWLSVLARSSDVLCQTMAEAIQGSKHLIPLLKGDLKLPRHFTKRWHAFLLTLLAVPRFKMELAQAYCDTYGEVTREYARGIGVSEASSFTLSVQFLNRQTYVRELAAHRQLLNRLANALFLTLSAAQSSPSSALDPHAPVLAQRRYSPCISDIKCVLNVQGMPRLFASKCLGTWIRILSMSQGMDKQQWRSWSDGHVETEPRGWVGAFNCSISLGSLFERVLTWDDDDVSKDSSVPLRTCRSAAHLVFDGVVQWQMFEVTRYQPASSPLLQDHERCPAALPYSTVHVKLGTALAQPALPLSQVEPWSFHYPLHRFLAVNLREVARREPQTGLESWMEERCHDQVSWRHVLEFPVWVLSRAAQVRADMWKRNGSNMVDQVLNYAEPPFCRSLRDTDLSLIQYATVALSSAVDRDGASLGGTSFMINLLLHRYGVFEFAGFANGPNQDYARYKAEVKSGLYPAEATPTSKDKKDRMNFSESMNNSIPLPSTSYFPPVDPKSSLDLLEEVLHVLIILVTELPCPPSSSREVQIEQGKRRLRREVVHRLVSGAKTHSEFSEVHHVLPQRDNTALIEEGRAFNPNDASGALLEITLQQVATRRPTRGLDPDQWVLQKELWEEYDPAFFHIGRSAHQSAAEIRPKATNSNSPVASFPPRPYCPRLSPAHNYMTRLRRDITADGAVVSLLYRTLHTHLSDLTVDEETIESHKDLRGKSAYAKTALNETILARAVHLLTLGAYCWEDAPSGTNWFSLGGSGVGSIFHGRSSPPTVKEWIEAVLLENPAKLMDSDWYRHQDRALTLLQRLAAKGEGREKSFVAQDSSLRSGAAWLCDFCVKHSEKASRLLNGDIAAETPSQDAADEMERRKREAKERAMKRFAQMQAAAQKKFLDYDDATEDEKSASSSRKSPFKAGSSFIASDDGYDSAKQDTDDYATSGHEESSLDFGDGRYHCLLKERPTCIHCHDDSSLGAEVRKRKNQKDALAFCGLAQASTVLKGGGGPIPGVSVNKFVGVHIQLCGHAIHSSCCDAYLASSAARDALVDSAKRGEFRCPMCQRLSNCLVPFIDVETSWIDSEESIPSKIKDTASNVFDMSDDDRDSMDSTSSHRDHTLHDFLSESNNWVLDNSGWDGRCNFYRLDDGSPRKSEHSHHLERHILGLRRPSRLRRSIRSFGKKDLFAAWSLVMKSPRRRKSASNMSSAASDPAHDYSHLQAAQESLSGGTDVWGRLMDQISDVALKADSKRLGEKGLLPGYGEFRHYLTEQMVYNLKNVEFHQSTPSDWPFCVFGADVAKAKQPELEREKLISKLLFSIQCFTYSCCSESAEVRRLHLSALRNAGSHSSGDNFHSKFGVQDVLCDSKLILMPTPTLTDGGEHVFEGRFGKLRYFALAVITAASAVSKEVVQMSFQFPVANPVKSHSDHPRAPIVYPILRGQVLTHTVAAMCAVCGRKRAIDVLHCPDNGMQPEKQLDNENVGLQCVNFIKLGFLARCLQVLLGVMGAQEEDTKMRPEVFEEELISTVERYISTCPPIGGWGTENDCEWNASCAQMIQVALGGQRRGCTSSGKESFDKFRDACLAARIAGEGFLADAALILQVLVPGFVNSDRPGKDGLQSYSGLEGLASWLGVEDMLEMLDSERTAAVVACWYKAGTKLPNTNHMDDPNLAEVQKKLSLALFHELPSCDWPVTGLNTRDVCKVIDDDSGAIDSQLERAHAYLSASPRSFPGLTSKRMLCESPDMMRGSFCAPTHISPTKMNPALATNVTPQKCVPLMGALTHFASLKDETPRIKSLPVSYTDLYAQLGVLIPDSDQTAVCLVCGTVLNAAGKGECTKHAIKCGSGCGLFFLLQECVGLILHGKKAAYVHSPYVDSHGETPQYRGRPLNLDMGRYEILYEMWAGHAIREKVMAERAISRQVIIANFY